MTRRNTTVYRNRTEKQGFQGSAEPLSKSRLADRSESEHSQEAFLQSDHLICFPLSHTGRTRGAGRGASNQRGRSTGHHGGSLEITNSSLITQHLFFLAMLS